MAARRPASSNLAILITADEQMQAVPVSDHIAANDIGANPIDTITTRSNVVFWFNTASQSPVNRMATLNGAYGAGLARYLHDHGGEVLEVPRPDRRIRRQRGKSDPIDDEAAARTVLAGKASGAPKLADGPIEAIRMLRIARNGAVKAARPP